MVGDASKRQARRVILRSRIIAGLLLLGSLALLVGGPALANKITA
jgi:hypothetical protein